MTSRTLSIAVVVLLVLGIITSAVVVMQNQQIAALRDAVIRLTDQMERKVDINSPTREDEVIGDGGPGGDISEVYGGEVDVSGRYWVGYRFLGNQNVYQLVVMDIVNDVRITSKDIPEDRTFIIDDGKNIIAEAKIRWVGKGVVEYETYLREIHGTEVKDRQVERWVIDHPVFE